MKNNTHFVFNNLIFEYYIVYETIWKNTVEPDRPRMINRLMRFACWSPKATDKHSKYVIFFCFSTATVFARTPLNDTLQCTLPLLSILYISSADHCYVPQGACLLTADYIPDKTFVPSHTKVAPVRAMSDRSSSVITPFFLNVGTR
jgi:hypothetical protein